MTSTPDTPDDVASRLDAVERRLSAACKASGRAREEITLVPVSKRQSVDKMRAALDAGARCFGENQVQEAETKASELPSDLEWHFIGHLQSNKTRAAVRLFDVFHSIDRLKIARAIDKEAGRQGRRPKGFLQVNVGDESSKQGFSVQEVVDVALTLGDLEHLDIVGLMTLPPYEENPEDARRWFRDLRLLRDALATRGMWRHTPGLLSMGMSHDLEAAIAEGATHLRIGTSIFGPRST